MIGIAPKIFMGSKLYFELHEMYPDLKVKCKGSFILIGVSYGIESFTTKKKERKRKETVDSKTHLFIYISTFTFRILLYIKHNVSYVLSVCFLRR